MLTFIIDRISNVTGVSTPRGPQPERWREGENRAGRTSQSSPVTKKTEMTSRDESQGNPNESLSDWEEEFLGELYFM